MANAESAGQQEQTGQFARSFSRHEAAHFVLGASQLRVGVAGVALERHGSSLEAHGDTRAKLA